MSNQTRPKKIIGLILLLVLVVGVTISRLEQVWTRTNTATLEEVVEQSQDEGEVLVGPTIEDQLRERNQVLIDRAIALEKEELEAIRKRIYQFAIFATDERGEEIPRSDIIMILEYIPRDHQVTLVSTPRDTRVMIPRRYKDKINHAYAFGGPSLMQETLESFYQLEIEYYFRVSFDDFIELIDYVGGVSIHAKKDYKYPGRIDIKAGDQVLDGKKALDYVRFRYDEDGDHGRILRQQEVIKSLLDKLSSHGDEEIEAYLAEFYKLIDTDISIEEMTNLYKVYDREAPLNFETHTLKTRGTIINGIWYEIYDEEDLERLKALFQQLSEWP